MRTSAIRQDTILRGHRRSYDIVRYRGVLNMFKILLSCDRESYDFAVTWRERIFTWRERMADSSDDTTDLCILAGIYGTQIKRRFTHLFCDTCCAGIRAGKFRNNHQVE